MEIEVVRSIAQQNIHGIAAVLAGGAAPVETAASAGERCAAVAMILREPAPGAVEVLFIRRAQRAEDPWSGQMAFPGGHVEEGDESLEAAARREALEEVGLRLDADMLIGNLDAVQGRPVRSVVVAPFVYHYASGDAAHALSDEVDEVVWVPLAYLADAANLAPYRVAIERRRGDFQAFHYGRYVIWGLTLRIIDNFMRRFGIALPVRPPGD